MMVVSRRNLIISCALGLGSQVPLVRDPLLASFSQSYVNMIVAKRFMDSVDQDPYYCVGWSESEDYNLFWKSETEHLLRSVVFQQPLPPDGKVVELGIYRGHRFELLQSFYGTDRCVGVDVVDYTDGKQKVILADVRDLKSTWDQPISLAWNNVGSWKNSPQSKWAGLQLVSKHLIKGGLLIEDHVDALPREFHNLNFKLLYTGQAQSCFLKV